MERNVSEAFSHRLKAWDLQSNRGVDNFVAISRTVQQRIQRVYGCRSVVIYPSVDLEFFRAADAVREEFYLIVSALVPQKRIDLAVEAFNRTGKPLWIVGTGPLWRHLRRKARSNIHFLGGLSDEEVRQLYSRARALIFPGSEDFGLVPVEAQACGCPVVAYGEGGATETVVEGETGLFFPEATPESLGKTLCLFERTRFADEKVVKNARRFDRARFRSEWRHYFKKLGVRVEM